VITVKTIIPLEETHVLKIRSISVLVVSVSTVSGSLKTGGIGIGKNMKPKRRRKLRNV
jgi:hypothetical protein